MRNLKKVLSLVLCMAMMLSIMVVGAGAASFKDKDKIVNDEAVDMCVALNIINGYTDGSYRPEGNVTRAEMCKMICIALNGGKEPATATKAVPTYSDIDGHWAEGYIEYCNTKGIVAGVGGGKFNPNGNVTGSQAAKMLLIALGYNADVEKYVGASWELSVNVQANQDGLYTDLEKIDTSAALNRDNAAQMIWNALQAYVIDKTSSIDREDGSITDMYSKSDSVDLLEKMYNGEIEKGILDAFDYNSKDAEWTYTVTLSVPKTDSKGNRITEVDVVSSTDYTDLLGQKVKAVYKYDTNAKENTVYGIFTVDSEVVLTGLIGDLPKMTNSADTSFKVDGVTYKLQSGLNLASLPVYQFTSKAGVPLIADTKDDETGKTIFNSTLWNVAGQNGRGVNITAYDAQEFSAVDVDGNGKIDFISIVPFTVAKVSYVGSDKFRLSGSDTNYNLDDVNVYSGIAKDDFVIFTKAANTADDTDTFVKADKISGEVTKVDSPDIMIDGTWYTVDASYGTISGGAAVAKVTAAAAKLTDAVVVNGYVFYVDKADSTAVEDFAVVIATESGGVSGSQAKLLFSDGSKVVVDTDKNYASGSNYIANGTLVTYSKNSDNEYILKTADKTDGASYDLCDQGANAATVTKVSNGSDKAGYIDGAYVDDDSVIFINYKGNSYKVITGAQLKKMDVADFATDFANGYVLGTTTSGSNHVDMAYIATKDAKDINDADTYYGYVTSVVDIQNGDKENVKLVTVWTANGEKTFETAANKTAGADTIEKRNVIEYKLNADGEISQVLNSWDVDGITEPELSKNADGEDGTDTVATVAITSLAPTLKVQINGIGDVVNTISSTNDKDFMDLDSDTVYIYIENTDAKGMDKVDLSTADDDVTLNTRVPNAFIVVDKDGDVALVVYDIDNKIAE